MKLLKCVLIGASGVGKTAFVGAVRGKFAEEYKPTNDAAFSQFTFHDEKNEQVTLSIWDIPGQEDKDSRLPFYLRDNAVPIFVVDLSQSIKKGNPQRERLSELYQRANECFTDGLMPCFLVATKSDSESRQVTKQDLAELAKEFDVISFPKGKKVIEFSAKKETAQEQKTDDIENPVQHRAQEIFKTIYFQIARQPSHSHSIQAQRIKPALIPKKPSNYFWLKCLGVSLLVGALVTLTVLSFGATVGAGIALTFASAAASSSASGGFVTAGVVTVFGGSSGGMAFLLALFFHFKKKQTDVAPPASNTWIKTKHVQPKQPVGTSRSRSKSSYASSLRPIQEENSNSESVPELKRGPQSVYWNEQVESSSSVRTPSQRPSSAPSTVLATDENSARSHVPQRAR